MKMKATANIVGFIGLLGLIAGGITYHVEGGFGPVPTALLIAGGIFAVFCLIVNVGGVMGFVRSRKVLYGGNLVLAVALMLAILVVFQLIVTKADKRFDLTETKRYSISPQSQQIVENLEKDVKVTVFYRDDTDKKRFGDLLSIYAYYNGAKFKYEMVQPDRKPERAQLMDIDSYNTFVVECGDRKEELLSPEEEDLTNALIKVTRLESTIVYFTAGHGEPGLSDSEARGMSVAKSALEKEVYEVKDILLAREERGVPGDCSILVVAGPEKPFFMNELQAIREYVDSGGRVLFLLDPETVPGVVSLLADLGVTVGNDYVVDPNPVSQLMGGSYMTPLVTDYSTVHQITKEFATFATLFPLSRSVQTKSSLPTGTTGEWIARASDRSWGETNLALLKSGNRAKYDQGSDVKGPVPLAVALTRTIESGAGEEETSEGRVIVVGDSDFSRNGNLQQAANKDFLLNIAGWLSKQEDLISIRPKEKRTQTMLLSAKQARVLTWVPLAVVPALSLIAGGLVYVRRRKYR